MAKDRGIPAQQLQQNFLIEQVLKLIAKSSYKDSFIVKGGYPAQIQSFRDNGWRRSGIRDEGPS